MNGFSVARGNPTDEELAALVTALAAMTARAGEPRSGPGPDQTWRTSALVGYRKAPSAWGAAATAWRPAGRRTN